MVIVSCIRWPRLVCGDCHVRQRNVPKCALLCWLELWCSQHKETRSITLFAKFCLSSLPMRGRKTHRSRTIITLGNAQASFLKSRGPRYQNRINTRRSATRVSCGSRSRPQRKPPWNSTWQRPTSLFIVSWKPTISNLEYFLIIKSFSWWSGILNLDKDPNK